MADISKLQLNNSIYNIKDNTARANINSLSNSLGTAAYADVASVAIGVEGEDLNALPSVEKIKAYISNKVSGSMHFKGVISGEERPSPAGYDSGDIIIWKNKEFVCYENGGVKSWEQLGDDITLYATQTSLDTVKGTGWTSSATVQGNADAISGLQTTVNGHTTSIGDITSRVSTIESAPYTTITQANINTWNDKQATIPNGSATVASISNDIITIKNSVLQNAGAITTDTTPADDITLSKVASTGNASDLTQDSNNRLVTDAEKANWNSNTNYITSVDEEFSVTNGKLDFATGFNALLTTEKNKLGGISDGATKSEDNHLEENGTIKIDGVKTVVYTLPQNVVQDPSYSHITVTGSSVSDGTTTFNQYTHPTGTGANNSLDLYKISTDSTSHIASVEAVDGDDIAGYLEFITAYNPTTNKIATAADVAGGIHFKGVTQRATDSEGEPTESYAQALARIVPNPLNGDLAVVDAKEFIFNDTDNKWYEVGDENAWDSKGSAAQALIDAKAYADTKVGTLSGIATADTGYALTEVSEVNGVISKTGQVALPVIPQNISAFTNDLFYATQSWVRSEINTAIGEAIAAGY